jgi:hypothetical protein
VGVINAKVIVEFMNKPTEGGVVSGPIILGVDMFPRVVMGYPNGRLSIQTKVGDSVLFWPEWAEYLVPVCKPV